MPSIILVIAGTGYHPEEYKKLKEELESQNINVVTVSDIAPDAIAEDESRTNVDLRLSEVDMENYGGVIFLGGAGAEKYLNNHLSYQLAVSAKNKDKIYGAIQVSTRILARAGVLEYKEATGWNEDNRLEGILRKNNAEYEDKEPVVIDGKAITAVNSDSAEKFGRAIARELKG